MLRTDLNTEVLEENFHMLLERHPLDEVIDGLEGAFRRRAGELRHQDGDQFRNVALELQSLKRRDYLLWDED